MSPHVHRAGVEFLSVEACEITATILFGDNRYIKIQFHVSRYSWYFVQIFRAAKTSRSIIYQCKLSWLFIYYIYYLRI